MAIREAVQSLGTAAIYVSHDLAVVAQMADRVMVLRNGETVEEAPTRTMLSSPQQDYPKSLWAVRTYRAPARQPVEALPSLVRIEGVDAAYGAKGAKEEIFRPPHHPYTELLFSSVPEMDPDWLSRLKTSA